MKRMTALALVLALALTGCAGTKPNEKTLTPEERTQLYETAITAARDEETNQYQSILTSAGEDDAEMVFALLGVGAEDMSAYALSVSLMNVQAYAVAAVYPAAGKEDAVLEGLRSFVDNQKQSFEQYLVDQYEIAANARLETLEDGTVLLVMCENQDAVFDAIADAIVKGK